MSFDLYALDLDELPTPDELVELLEAEEESDDGVEDSLTPALTALLAEVGRRWPGESEEELDRSPWSSWPLDQPVLGGRGNAFNFRWSLFDKTLEEFLDTCRRHGLAVYDPQTHEILPAGPSGRRWWRRG